MLTCKISDVKGDLTPTLTLLKIMKKKVLSVVLFYIFVERVKTKRERESCISHVDAIKS